MGVAISYGGTYIQTGAGNITINGTSNSGASSYADGVAVHGARVTTSSGAINITGIGGGVAGSNYGVRFDPKPHQASAAQSRQRALAASS